MKKDIKKIYRSKKDRIIVGVAGGLGEYFEIDPIIFRVLFILLLFAGGFALLLYIVLALVIPLKPENSKSDKKQKNRKKKENKVKKTGFSAKHLIGLIVILIGWIVLFGQLFPIAWQWFRWGIFWAIIIIVIGFFLLLKD